MLLGLNQCELLLCPNGYLRHCSCMLLALAAHGLMCSMYVAAVPSLLLRHILQQLHRLQYVLLVGVYNAAVHQHLIHYVVHLHT
jgi:hypothetical protein